METFIVGVAVVAMIFLVCLVISALLRWLWNMTVPQVFGLKEITYWQAFRILIIAAISSICIADSPSLGLSFIKELSVENPWYFICDSTA